MKKINIAIDGFAGCGKSTTARLLANKLNYLYIDTGAMYRAVTLYFIRNLVQTASADSVAKALQNITVRLAWLGEGQQQVLLNGEDVTRAIRQMEVNQRVSEVSALPRVRTMLVQQQQQTGLNKGVVMDGRDIGTVVFPDAELKIFMTASIEERASRRLLELQKKGVDLPLEEVARNLQQRDNIDSQREASPLKKADDAIEIDTTGKTIDQQVETAFELAVKVIGSAS